MPELSFHITGVEPEPFSATPTLRFALEVAASAPVRNLSLRCQVRIEPARRSYGGEDFGRLSELFGPRRRWGETLRSFLWDHVDLQLPGFRERAETTLPLACPYDFNVAATRYAHGLSDGEIPLRFLFSGAIFYDGPDRRLQIANVPWSAETSYRLPVAVWRSLMAQHYPEHAWLQVRHEVFERLERYRRERGFADWNAALDSLVPATTPEGAS